MQELKFNNRKKLHRFLQTLPEGMVFFSNNEFRIHMPKGYISVGDDYHDYHYRGGSTNYWGYKRVSDNIRDVKELIDKCRGEKQNIDKVLTATVWDVNVSLILKPKHNRDILGCKYQLSFEP